MSEVSSASQQVEEKNNATEKTQETTDKTEVVTASQQVQVVKKSNLRNKIFSLVLLFLLIIPALLVNPKGTGMVLGVTENTADKGNSELVLEEKELENLRDSPSHKNQGLIGSLFADRPKANPIPKKSQLGQIGSGAMEIRTIEEEKPIVRGKVVWDKNAKTAVATDKFSLGTSVVVSHKEKNLSLVVGDNRVLSADTVLVVDKETFIKLGGNPEIENSLEVTARAE